MHFTRGNCVHLKAKWNNHPSCLSCTACLRSSPCSFCNVWSDKVWNLAENRRLYSTRSSVMTQRRKQKKNKKRIQSDLSDTGSHDGSTAPHSYTGRGRTNQSGSPGDQVSDRALSPPVTGQQVTGQPVTSHPVTSQPVTGQPVTGQHHRSTSHWSSNHWSASHRSSSHWSASHYCPFDISWKDVFCLAFYFK